MTGQWGVDNDRELERLGSLMHDFDDDGASSPYSRKVGDRLRVIRKQKRLSLQEVESTSTEEFKASGVFLPTCTGKAQEYVTAIWTELQK